MIVELLGDVYEHSRSKGNTFPLLLSLISIVLFVAMATRVANSVNFLALRGHLHAGLNEMMSVTPWSSLVGWFAPHALNRILLIECLNTYDRRPRPHPRLLALHLSFLQASPLRNTALGGSPRFNSSRNRFSFVARQVDPLPPRIAAQLSSSPSPHGVSPLFCPQHSPPLRSFRHDSSMHMLQRWLRLASSP